MKKLVALLAITSIMTFGLSNVAYAQDETETTTETTQAADSVDEAEATPAAAVEEEEEVVVEKSFNQVLKDKFIEGGAGWMTPILLILILGLALVIERIIYLNLSTVNTKKLLLNIEDALKKGDIEAAKEICRNTRGPVASVFYQGLDRYDEGMEEMEKAVISYGGVQTARLESNMSWIGFCIAVAPSLGFLGTVVGMVQAFDDIEKAGDISPTIVAGGMKVALITTVTGLIVAIILQLFYSYLVSKIDSLTNTMEDATISYMDIVVKYKK
ncbi:MAG: MotA/TolQ/ExbB proton channel family protein [Bacteroidales bacterium]|nr:MotA/TolQ/ExbB proton channel family protein [Bacteroidales bacterium]MDD4209077.1 MotA/TolQ/ExbB proton channel family protein [Bacteroidales bacterium]